MPPKQKADTAGYQQLKKDLAGGEPGRLYLFHGEETYLRDHYLGRLKELLLTGGMGEFNLHTIPAREMSPRRLEEAVDCLPMMAPRTLVLVRDFDLFKAGEKDREEYARAFAQLPDYCCLVFVYDLIPYKGDARTKLAAAIKQNGTVVNFARQDQGDLVDWVRRRCAASPCRTSPSRRPLPRPPPAPRQGLPARGCGGSVPRGGAGFPAAWQGHPPA